MYKAGKRWIYASLTALSLGLSLAMIPDQVHAAVATPETTTEQKISETPAPEVSTPETPTMPKQSSLEVPASETSESEVPAPSEVPKSETSETEDIIESPKKTEVPDEGPVTDAKTPAPETGTVKSDAPTEAEPAQTTGTLSETYDDAKTQTDQANTAAETANAHLAELQALLADPDLTQTEGWQDKLQAQLAQFQDAAAAFGATKAQTDATVADYQAAIDAVIADKPNAVATVTQGSETTGQTMTDYDGLVTDYQQQVTTALEKIATQVKNYTQVDTINAAQATLQTAAETLNAQLKAVGPGDDLTMLQDAKAAYDTALSAYNTAVSTYDDQQVIHQNAADETDETKNPADTSFDKLVDYLNTKTAYDAAHQAYQDTADQAIETQKNLEAWQKAVTAYQTALDQVQSINVAQLKKADATAMTAAKTDITDKATALETAQATYLATSKEDDVAVKAASDAVNNAIKALNESVSAYQTVYQTYLNDVETQATKELPAPVDLTAPQQAVLEAQATLQTSVTDFQESQTHYQTALTNYQASLDAAQVDLKASDVAIGDLTTLKTKLTNQFVANEAAMKVANQLPAVKQAESELQQRVNQINGLVTGINHNQEVWQAISDAAAATNTWAYMATSLQTVGDNALAMTELYKTAIKDTTSYRTLVETYATALTAYNQVADTDASLKNTYTAPDQLEANLTEFSEQMTNFETAFHNLLDSIASNVPNADYNEQAKETMQKIENLSTDGSISGLEVLGARPIVPTVAYYEGPNLSSFLSDGLVEASGNLNSDWHLTIPAIMPNDVTLMNEAGEPTNIADVVEGQKYYYRINDDVLGGYAAAFRKNLPATYVGEDGLLYRLTGTIVRGNLKDKDGSNVVQLASPKALSDFYVFTTTDPIAEFMGLLKGSSTYTQNAASYKFYYVADTQNSKQITDSDGHTRTTSAVTLPSVEAIQDLTNTATDLVLTATGTLPTVPAPNAVAVPEMTSYLGGTPLTTELTLDQIDQAPLLTLNKVAQPTPPTDPDEPVDPSTDPVTPMIPVGPINPEQPTDETGGTDPADPEQPTDETDETDPTDPEQPTDETGDTDSAEPTPETPGTSSDGENETTLTPETNANVESENHNDTDKATAQSTTEYAQNLNTGTGGMSAINGATRTATSKAMTIKNNMTTRVGAASTAKTLPQTGERHEQQRLQLIGTALLTLVTVFGGWLTTKKRKV